MGIESLIPFGLDAESGELVDVGSVKRGKACGCICPSCKTPLLARHGDAREWHFAHRSVKVHGETRKVCEYSFAVSVRLMIQQLSNEGLRFRTPGYEITLPASDRYPQERPDARCLVAKESVLTLADVQVGAEFCGVTVDVLGYVERVPFVVFVTYRGRSLPSDLKKPSKTMCGVVDLSVNALPALFSQEAKGQYKEALRLYIEDRTDGKSWAYHPREHRIREEYIKEHKLRENAGAPPPYSSNSRHREDQIGLGATGSYGTKHKSGERTTKNYTCRVCKSTWTGKSRVCKKCNTDIFTTESN